MPIRTRHAAPWCFRIRVFGRVGCVKAPLKLAEALVKEDVRTYPRDVLHHGVSASVRLEGLAVLKLAVKARRSSGKGIFWLFRRRVRSAVATPRLGQRFSLPDSDAPFSGRRRLRFWVVLGSFLGRLGPACRCVSLFWGVKKARAHAQTASKV